MDLVRELILKRLKEKGLNMAAASRRMGLSHSYLQQFLKRGVPAELLEPERIKLAEILELSEDQLRGPSSPLPKREYVKVNPTARESLISDGTRAVLASSSNEQGVPQITPAAELFGNSDLPVFGTAQGGRGALIVTDRAVDWVARPTVLLRVQDGYGMIVTGDSMAPEHKSGSTALVNPHLPPRVGDSCVFRSHADDGTVHAVIKELRGETDTAWKVRQHNPKKDFTLKKTEWQVVHKTVGNYFA
jgi:phage repressor protein C with HTH and peptisase S24 domain/lambda repressor-like predicted transcriptional regulator